MTVSVTRARRMNVALHGGGTQRKFKFRIKMSRYMGGVGLRSQCRILDLFGHPIVKNSLLAANLKMEK